MVTDFLVSGAVEVDGLLDGRKEQAEHEGDDDRSEGDVVELVNVQEAQAVEDLREDPAEEPPEQQGWPGQAGDSLKVIFFHLFKDQYLIKY